jgi:hypothetical protein
MQRINLKFVDTVIDTRKQSPSCYLHVLIICLQKVCYNPSIHMADRLAQGIQKRICRMHGLRVRLPSKKLEDCEQVWAKPSFYLPHMLIAGVAAGGKAVTVRKLLTTICIVRHLPRMRQSRFIEACPVICLVMLAAE